MRSLTLATLTISLILAAVSATMAAPSTYPASYGVCAGVEIPQANDGVVSIPGTDFMQKYCYDLYTSGWWIPTEELRQYADFGGNLFSERERIYLLLSASCAHYQSGETRDSEMTTACTTSGKTSLLVSLRELNHRLEQLQK